MRITTKFIGSSAVIITLTAVLLGGSYVSYRNRSEALDASYEQAQSNVANVVQLELALKGQIVALNRLAVIADDEEELKRYEQSRQIFLHAIDQLENTLPQSDTLSHIRLTNLRSQQQYLESVASQLTDRTVGNEPIQNTDIEAITRSLRLFEAQIEFHGRALLQSAYEQTALYRLQKKSAQRQTQVLGMLSFGSILLLLIAQYYGLLKPVVRSLNQLQSHVDAIGRSPLTDIPKIHLKTRDELQAVGNAFNQMSDRLVEAHRELEKRVAQRTASLHVANQSLAQEVNERIETEKNLSQAISQLKQAQLQLLQSERMSSLSQLVAGVAHEINNPASFIQGNLEPAQDYVETLLGLLQSYQTEYPEASAELQTAVAQADLDFMQADFPLLIQSVQTGVDRITEIVRSLQIFSHHDESETKAVDIHQGIDSALLILTSKLNATDRRPAITVKKDYGSLPKVYCYPGQLNQVFMGLLTNAIEALGNSSHPTITISTMVKGNDLSVSITDNGIGMDAATKRQIFDPFFTTKSVGEGNGLGLAMSYQIVSVNHQGTFICDSQLGVGSTFSITIPLSLKLMKQPLISGAAA